MSQVALIRSAEAAERAVRHTVGIPPQAGEIDTRSDLAWPAFVVMKPGNNGFFLVRFDADGEFAGDTWHLNEDELSHQLRLEFHDDLEWIDVPTGADEVAFGLTLLRG